MARLWLHSELVMSEGKKVSRAAGNDLTLEHLREQGFDGPAVRYWLLANHYRTVLHYSPEELRRAAQSVTRLNEFVSRLGHPSAGRPSADVQQILHQARAGWQQALDNDLNLPKALGRLFVFLRQVNRLLNGGELDEQQAAEVLDFMRQVDAVLAVIDFDRPQADQRVVRLIEERAQARAAKDFRKADALRDELLALGVRPKDAAAGKP